MSLFFFSIVAVYGLVHVYTFLRARSVFGFGWGAGTALALFMVVMVFALFLIRQLERNEYELAARALSYVAYIWMAVIFLFFCGSLLLDIANLALRSIGSTTGSNTGFLIPANISFFISAALSLSICVYGYFDALDIRTERLQIETTKLPPGIDRLRIVQISDVHLGLIVRCDRMQRIMNIVKAEKPDLFISTGDLVDAQINQLTGLAEILREVDPKYGKYAITGNHEFYAGIEQALRFTREAGFTLLRGEAVTDGPIAIAGVDDPAGVAMKLARRVSEKKLLEVLPKDKFVLFLKHQPRLDPEAQGLFDLQLSGHTHKGQIYPFRYVSELVYPLNAGRFGLPGGKILYVSRGTGTWGPPIRFLSPPEVTVIDLVRKKE